MQYIVWSVGGAVARLFVGLLHRSLLPPAVESSVSIQPIIPTKNAHGQQSRTCSLRVINPHSRFITYFIITFILTRFISPVLK